MSSGILFDAIMAVALLVLGWGFAQFLLWYRWGTAELRDAIERPSAPSADYRLVFLVPCLDEEAVVGDTVAELCGSGSQPVVIVVDDASDDRTAEIARAAGATVVQRTLPDARQGKGPALNAGLAALDEIARRERWDPKRTVVCVMDADGRLSPSAIREVLARFDDQRVGGVQLPVRIRNNSSFLGSMQDFEFWGMSAIAQMARNRTSSVSLGGNGQFTRLAALRSVGPRPWSQALTEDLDLGIELTQRGWALACAPAAWVSQQGVETMRGLLRQRTRWYQGHIACGRKAHRLWESPAVARRTALETTIYLLTPTFVMLPWSIAFTLGLAWFVGILLGHSPVPLDSIEVSPLFYAAFWYVLTFLPPVVLGVFYAQRTEGVGLASALAKGHVQVFYSYVNLAAVWRALGRTLLGREGWAKTARVVERRRGDELQNAA